MKNAEGPPRMSILQMAFIQGMLIVGIGLVLGLAAALAAARVAGNFLAVSATNSLT
jgi:hypothetical protein